MGFQQGACILHGLFSWTGSLDQVVSELSSLNFLKDMYVKYRPVHVDLFFKFIFFLVRWHFNFVTLLELGVLNSSVTR